MQTLTACFLLLALCSAQSAVGAPSNSTAPTKQPAAPPTATVPYTPAAAAPAGYAIGNTTAQTLLPQESRKGKVSAQTSFLDGFFSTLANGGIELAGGCVYGLNCGSGCSTYKKGRSGTYLRGDKLDLACYNHDKCLSEERWDKARYYCIATGKNLICHCERNLRDAANAVYNSEKKCAWWKVWCFESNRVNSALATKLAMDQRIRCGKC